MGLGMLVSNDLAQYQGNQSLPNLCEHTMVQGLLFIEIQQEYRKLTPNVPNV